MAALLILDVRAAITWPVAASGSRTDAPELRVSARDGLLSVEAQAASWVQLLDEVSRATGTRFHLLGSHPELITIAFRDLSAAQALRRLFGPDANYVFRFREAEVGSASPAFPSEVWVLAYGPGKEIEAAGARAAPLASVVTNESSAIEKVEKEFATNPLAAREAALGSAGPAIRRRAILHFGWQGDQEALDVLTKVAQDRDPEVRGEAVDALELFLDQPGMRRRTVEVLGRLVDRHPRVREVLVHVMETAEQADLRQLAADSLGVPLDGTTGKVVSRDADREPVR